MASKPLLLGTIAVLLVICIILAIGIGSVRFLPSETWTTLIGKGTDAANTIIWDIRIPRVLLALLIGANLAASGALLQAVMMNPLADPGLTGVSSGAAVTVLFIILVMPQYTGLIPLAAILYSDKLPAALQWMNGSLSGKSMADVYAILPYSAAGWIMAILCIRQANILRLGEQTAHNLGQNLNRVRFTLSFVAVFLAAVSVAKVGLVGFVGLIVPHIARMLIGSDYKYSLPLSLMLGPVILIIADTIGRAVFSPLEIPAGIVMAMAGGPYFLYLMRKGGA